MRITEIHATDDMYIQFHPYYSDNGEIIYITVYNGKEKQNKIYITMHDGGKQIDDLIQILTKFHKIAKEQYKEEQHS